MEHQANRKRDNRRHGESQGSDEVDRADTYPRAAPRRQVNRPIFQHELSPAASSTGGFERLESPGQDDSAYHTFPHTSSTSHHSFSKSSSVASSERFPSSDSLRSGSPFGSSKKNHSTLIRIQLGDDKKVSHEWYSEFTQQSHQQHKTAFSSPLANRSANSSSQFEYDSHIAHMRGKFVRLKHIQLA